MDNLFINKWCEYSKEATKPFLELMELNLHTFNKWTKQAKSMQEFTRTNSPEELFTTQRKMGAEVMQSWNEYLQKVSAIYIESAAHFGNIFQGVSEDFLHKTSENIKEQTNRAQENVKKYKNE